MKKLLLLIAVTLLVSCMDTPKFDVGGGQYSNPFIVGNVARYNDSLSVYTSMFTNDVFVFRPDIIARTGRYNVGDTITLK